jgi:hypothetical protein
MRPITEKTLRIASITLKVVLIVVLLSTIGPFIDLYSYFKEHPTDTYTYEVNDPPAELVRKLELVKPVRQRIVLGLFVLALYIFLDYLRHPKDYPIINKIRRHTQ